MYTKRAFVVLAASTLVAALLQDQELLRYDIQQHQQQAVLEAKLAIPEKTPPTSAAEDASLPGNTRCPHDEETTLLTTTFTPESGPSSPMVSTGSVSLSLSMNSTAQALATQATNDADTDGEIIKDEGAAGPVAKASLFPLVIGLAAAVVML